MQDTFESLRPRLEDYLRSRGINPEKRFRCLNPDHFDRHPSMSYDPKRYKAHCFACGADYDLFDLLILDGDAQTSRDALAEASRRYGNGSVRPAAESGCSSFRSVKKPSSSDRTQEKAASGKRNAGENTAYIEECTLHRGETGYFAQRGISETTAERFGLGYDPERRCVVLPSGDGDFIRRSIEGKQYLNEKGRPSPLFQKALLGGKELVFLTEGTFDALSAEELGCRAAALNGSGNREKAAAILRQLPERQSAMVLLLPDADAAGDAWASALTEEFPWLYRCPPVPIAIWSGACWGGRRSSPRPMRPCPPPGGWNRWSATLMSRPGGPPGKRASSLWTPPWTGGCIRAFMCWERSVPWARPPSACRLPTSWPRRGPACWCSLWRCPLMS